MARRDFRDAFVFEKYLIHIVASGEGVWPQDQELAQIPRAEFSAAPAVVRVGKMPNSGEAKDHSDPGPPGWSRADWLRLYRSQSAALTDARLIPDK